MKLPQVGFGLPQLLVTRHRFVYFDITSHVDIDWAIIILMSDVLAQLREHQNVYPRIVS